jgi:glycosyltransferase involved in cell wall biosynthesis
MKKRLRVALFVPWLYLKGGSEKTILKLVQGSRHDFTVFTSHFDSGKTFPEFGKIRVIETARAPVQRGVLQLAEVAAKLSSLKLPLEEGKFDALVVSTAGFGEFALFRNHSLPTLGICHTPLKVIHDSVNKREWLKGKKWQLPLFKVLEKSYRHFEKLAWKRFSFVYCDSKEVKERILRAKLIDGERVSVLYPGIDLGEFRPCDASKQFFFLPGRIMWHKNIELAIGAFKEFEKHASKNKEEENVFKLVIAGQVDGKSKEYFEKLKRLAQRSTLGIEFVVSPSDEEYERLYRECYCVLYPALNEDWGLVPVEAMALGKPVIALNEGGPRESVLHKKTGFLLPNDAGEWAGAMLYLARNPEKASELGRKGVARAKEFSWEKFVKAVDEKLEELVAGKA